MQTLKLIKKYEKYPEYKDSGVEWLGMIPKDWETVSSRQLFTTTKERVGSSFGDYKILSLTLRGVIPRVLDGSGKNPAEYDTYQAFKKDDLVFCLFDYDVTPRTIGYVEEDGMMTSAYTRLIPKQGIYSKYFYYYFLVLDFNKDLLHLCTGLRNSLSKPVFWSMINSLPNLIEQERIAKYLDEKLALIDQIIEKKQLLITLLKEKRNATISKQIVENIGKDCKIQKIKHLVKSIESGIWGENPLSNEDDIKCLRIADFDYDNFSYSTVETIRNNPKLQEKKVLRKGDVLMEKSGGGEKTPVGRAILFSSDERMVCANFIDKVRVNNEKILPEFLVLYLSVLYAGRVNTKYIKQNTGIQNMDIKEYFRENICYPGIKTQKSLTDFVNAKISASNKAISDVEKTIETLKEFKNSLISNVVTGKIKV